MYKENVFLSFGDVTVVILKCPPNGYKHYWYFLLKQEQNKRPMQQYKDRKLSIGFVIPGVYTGVPSVPVPSSCPVTATVTRFE